MINNKDIICISTSDWDLSWGSKQQLMFSLSRDNKVLYVEYQASFLHAFFPNVRRSFLHPFGRLRKESDRLFIFTPPVYLLPFAYYVRAFNKINQFIIFILISRIFKKAGFSSPILWVYPPLAADLIGYFPKSTVIYHCIADFPREKKSRLRSRLINKMEEDLCKRSELVIAMTDDLADKLKKNNPKVLTLASAVNFKYFDGINNKSVSLPDDLRNISRPILGVVGYLDAHVFDIGLLEYLADSKPEYSFVLIGPFFRGESLFND